MILGIVGCGTQKRDHPAQACDLYRNSYFQAKYRCAIRECHRVLILSALYGLIEPTRRISPYQLRVEDLSDQQRAELAEEVQTAISLIRPDLIRVYAGAAYRRLLGDLPYEIPYQGSILRQKHEMARPRRINV